jgi:hypothetical protein
MYLGGSSRFNPEIKTFGDLRIIGAPHWDRPPELF